MRRCDTCRFVAGLQDEAPHCRFEPPRAVASNGGSVFPFVMREWWCGEYRVAYWRWLKSLFRRSPRQQ